MKISQSDTKVCVKNLSEDELISALSEAPSDDDPRRKIVLDEYQKRVTNSVFSFPKNRNGPIS